EAAAGNYLYAWIAALSNTRVGQGAIVFDARNPDAEGPWTATVRSVRGEPMDLCGGYAVRLNYNRPSYATVYGECDMYKVVDAITRQSGDLVWEIGMFVAAPDLANVVRLRSLVRELEVELEWLANLELEVVNLPPWQREVFRDWVVTESQIVTDLAESVIDSFSSRDLGAQWESDKLKVRRLCRVDDAPDWCETARRVGYLD